MVSTTRRMGNGIMSGPLSERAGYQSTYPMDFMSGNESRNSRGGGRFNTRGVSLADIKNKPETAPGLKTGRFGES